VRAEPRFDVVIRDGLVVGGTGLAVKVKHVFHCAATCSRVQGVCY
jgi:hypothetical protein